MPSRIVVPEQLKGAPFRGTAVVASGLLTRRQLGSQAYVRIASDVYAVRGDERSDDVRRAALHLLAGDRAVVSGLTAAWLHGAWKPAPGQLVPLELTRPVRAPGTQVQGVGRRRLTLRGSPDLPAPGYGLSELDDDVVEIGGLAVTSQLRTCFDLMRQRQLVEAVAVADQFAYRCGMPLHLLEAYCDDRRRWPHVRAARVAVSLAVPGARSPGETRLRMVLVLSGYPEPFVNVDVVDERGGHVATPDLLLWTRRWVALEYDGGYHDEGEQPDLDRDRGNDITTDLDVPTLHYVNKHVRYGRAGILRSVAKLSDRPPARALDDRDFSRWVRGRGGRF